MKKWLRYGRLTGRMACSCMVRAGVWLLFFLLVGAGFFAAYQRLTGEQKREAMLTAAFALPEDDTYFHQLLTFLGSVPSVDSFCEIRLLTEEEALAQLADGQVQLLTVIPDDFFERTNRMEEAVFTVYVPSQMTPREKKYLAILRCIESGMETTECAISAVYPQLADGGITVDRRKLENDLLDVYVGAMLNRGELFASSSLSAFGTIPFLAYYTADAVLFWLLLTGALYLEMYTEEAFSFERVAGAGSAMRYGMPLIRVLVIGLQLFVILALAAVLGNAGCQALGSDFLMLYPEAFVRLFVIAVSMAAWIHLIGCLPGAQLAKRLLYYVSAFALALLSGGLLPVYYLPAGLRRCTAVLPYQQWLSGLFRALWPFSSADRTGMLLGVTGVLLLAGEMVYLRRLRGK